MGKLEDLASEPLPTAVFSGPAPQPRVQPQPATADAPFDTQRVRRIFLALTKSGWHRLPTTLLPWPMVVFFFLPWIDISCNDRVFMSQSGLETVYGGRTLSLEARGGKGINIRDQPIKNKENVEKASIPWSPLSAIHLLTVLSAVAIGIVVVFFVFSGHSRFGTACHFVLLILVLLSAALIIVQMSFGFPLERAIADEVRRNDARMEGINVINPPIMQDPAFRPVDRSIWIRYTFWLWADIFVGLLALPILLFELAVFVLRLMTPKDPSMA